MKFDDLTKVNVPFGLLDAATQEALRVHGGPYECWYDGDWFDTHNTDHPTLVHRVKPAPSVETIVEDMRMDKWGMISIAGTTLVRVTFNRINGVIDLASYKVEAR